MPGLAKRPERCFEILDGRPAVHAMLADGLVDELHLFMYPVALGTGRRLFVDSPDAVKLALTASQTYSNGVVHLAYAPS